MRTAVDTSVLLDFVTDDPARADAAERALLRAQAEGVLVVSDCVLAELRPALMDNEMREFLSDWRIEFVPGDLNSALLAGQLFSEYLQRRPDRSVVVPDFLIGAHAQVHADRLLARDRGYLRDYFRDLTVWLPT